MFIISGIGIVLLPCFLADPDPALIRLPHENNGLMVELWALTHPDLRNTVRVKALMGHLSKSLGSHQDLFAGRNTS